MTLPRYALKAFTHLDMHVKKGEEVDLHHPLVELRPDLFTTDPDEIPRKGKPTDQLTSTEVAEVFTETPTQAPQPEEPQDGSLRLNRTDDPAGHRLDGDGPGPDGGHPSGDHQLSE